MSFYTDGYIVVRGLVDKDVALELGKYMKAREMMSEGNKNDIQVPLSVSFYSDTIN